MGLTARTPTISNLLSPGAIPAFFFKNERSKANEGTGRRREMIALFIGLLCLSIATIINCIQITQLREIIERLTKGEDNG
jgi:hypothetical protein